MKCNSRVRIHQDVGDVVFDANAIKYEMKNGVLNIIVPNPKHNMENVITINVD